MAAINAGNAHSVNLNTANPADVICYIEASKNKYNGGIGVRISAIFVILFVSSAATFFPVLATRVTRFRIPLYIYLFARYFGAGVIVATAFVHLLDPAYAEIGPNTCVGMTGHWAVYSWPPAIALTSTMVVFLMDFAAERYVETRYGFEHADPDVEDLVTGRRGSLDAGAARYADTELASHQNAAHHHGSHQFLHSGDQDARIINSTPCIINESSRTSEHHNKDLDTLSKEVSGSEDSIIEDKLVERSFQQQIAAFLILEFGVIFHSVIIGLALGTAGPEFSTLYPVIVFHQSFEGLGIGARMSAIPFPKRVSWLPWALCTGYGLTTPIAIAAGLGVRTRYNAGSFTANVVSGVLDSTSAGILIYTGLVELLARDFLFNPDRTRDNKQLTFMIVSVLLGAGIMALLGKWA